MADEVLLTIKQGTLRGVRENSCIAFHGVPYASSGGRFNPCHPPLSFGDDEVFDATRPGPSFPQMTMRGGALGDYEEDLNQAEDAFIASIWTPELEGRLPVVIWIHGGGWMSGSGQTPSCSGREIASTGRCVFVTINYRLSCLGTIAPEGELGGNHAIRDILAAFTWVRKNIARFGGDPDKLVLAGQSAGAGFVAQLLGAPCLAGQIHRAALFSLPGDLEFMPADDAARIKAKLLEHLGASSLEEISELPAEKLIAAMPPAMPSPIYEEGYFDWPMVDGAASVSGASVPIFIGCTADEVAFFLPPQMRNAPEYWDIVAKGTKEGFWDGCDRFAGAFEDSGGQAYVYRFERPSQIDHLRACHCSELPYLFGNLDQWNDAPLLKDIDEGEFFELSDRFQGAFIDFVCGKAPWGEFDGTDASIERFS
ncbi:MAG: carboxylesterase family protein [bacterium]|nr:carboxylesterase family protein [bacterium]